MVAYLYICISSLTWQDIIHCHDWSSAPVTWLFKDHYVHYGLSKARVVFTIHNLEFGAHLIGKAMAYADKATTVGARDSLQTLLNDSANLIYLHNPSILILIIAVCLTYKIILFTHAGISHLFTRGFWKSCNYSLSLQVPRHIKWN